MARDIKRFSDEKKKEGLCPGLEVGRLSELLQDAVAHGPTPGVDLSGSLELAPYLGATLLARCGNLLLLRCGVGELGTRLDEDQPALGRALPGSPGRNEEPGPMEVLACY